jgi:predicted phage terminase large subunit-like protein
VILLPFTVEWEYKLNKLNQYKKKAKELRLSGQLTAEQLQAVIENIKVLEKDYIKSRGEVDILFFMYEFFSDDRNPENEGNLIPEGVSMEDAPDIHREICELLHEVSNVNVTKRICWSLPRSHAKSAILSNTFPVHQIVYRKRKYILIISETEGMARKFLDWINDQLKNNKKLRDIYGEDIAPDKKKGLKDNQEAFETASGTYVQSAGMGKRLRGARYKSYRPDLVICDDLESAQNTNTLELRQKSIEWFNKVIMPIGSPDRTAIIYMGTLVHPNSLLTHVLNRADFDGRIYSAIVSYPERADLWEQFEEIYRNQENPNRYEDALDFYFANKEEMDKGAKTLWPDRFPYYKLMMEKVNIGSRAFASEFLNSPVDDDSAIFKESNMIFFDDKDLLDKYNRPIKLDVYGYWDIAVGKNDRSDYNAIVIIGRDNRTGIIYVLDAWAKKCPMHEALEVAFDKIVQYRPKVFGVETVQAQYDMFRQLQMMVTKRQVYTTKVKAVLPRGRKEERIESLEPLFENGAIRLKRNQRLLIEMLTQYPTHDHDDLPDALAGAVDVSGGSRRQRGFYRKPVGM